MPISRGWKRKKLVKNYKRVCAPGSIRTKIVPNGRIVARLTVCCPKGQWKHNDGRCKVGMRAVSLDKPKSRGFGGYLHNRAAEVLGWSVKDTQSVSLAALRDLVRGADPALAAEISESIQAGAHIRGTVAADMSWLGPPPPPRRR